MVSSVIALVVAMARDPEESGLDGFVVSLVHEIQDVKFDAVVCVLLGTSQPHSSPPLPVL